MELKDDAWYHGMIKNGGHTGLGRRVKSDAYIIQGNFINGEPHGYCVEINSDFECYSGEFKHGMRHGYGRLMPREGVI